MTLLTRLKAFVESEATAAENFLAPVAKELEPIAEEALKLIVSTGITAGEAALSSGGSLSLTAVETAAIVAGRAMVASAQAQGSVLTEQTGMALAAAVGLTLPAPVVK
jgi:uncharacterized protein (DUF2345 family)